MPSFSRGYITMINEKRGEAEQYVSSANPYAIRQAGSSFVLEYF